LGHFHFCRRSCLASRWSLHRRNFPVRGIHAHRQSSNCGFPERSLQNVTASAYWLFCFSKPGRPDNHDCGSATRIWARPLFAYAHIHLIRLR